MEMSDRYFAEMDRFRERKDFYRFYKDFVTGGLRGFNGLNEELTIKEVGELIRGLATSYLDLSNDEYKERTLNQIKYDVDHSISECEQGPPIVKPFRIDLKRHYSIKCVNCLKKVSTKTYDGYWIAQSFHKELHGEKFCSEWCVTKYIDEVKCAAIKKKKVHYGI